MKGKLLLFITKNMKKNIILLIFLMALTSCNNHSETTNSNSNSISLDSVDYTLVTYNAKIDFSSVVTQFSSSYLDDKIVCEETYSNGNKESVLVEFASTSHQNTIIPYVPVIKAVDKEYSGPKYITLLSDTYYSIHSASCGLTIWSESDLNNIGTDYFVGIEYLENDSWKKLSSIDVQNIKIGAVTENISYKFDITADTHNIRLVFDFPNATGNVRFGVNSLEYEGSDCLYNVKNAENVTIQNKNQIIHEGETLSLITNFDDKKNQLNYHSSNRSVAVINKNGTIKALRVGTTEIKVSRGEKEDSFVLNVLNNQANKIIQDTASFNGGIPDGFSANFELTFFNGTYLNFKKQGNAVTTKIYDNINGKTSVILNMCLSSSANIEDSNQNVFAVEGLSATGEVLEKVQKTNLINLDFADITFDFTNPSIVQYRLVFETKYNYGKNYVLKSIQIFEK